MKSGLSPLSTLLAASTVALAQTSQPDLVILEPAEQTALSGVVTLSAEVRGASTDIRDIAFFVDGQEVCRVTRAPFQCTWNAGTTGVARNVRVVAEFPSAPRLVRTLRTPSAESDAASAGPIFRAQKEVVLVPVEVTDGRGHFVRDLTPEEFRVLEDGRPQTVTGILSEDTPASILLALDVSGSMSSSLPELRSAASVFLRGLRPHDVSSVAAFNDSLFVVAKPGVDRAMQVAALDGLKAWGQTALYDVAVKAVDLLKTQPAPRVLVLFTDGNDTASYGSAAAVRAAVQGSDVLMYLVAQGDSPKKGSSRDLLAGLANETGGGAWFSDRLSDLRKQFNSIVTKLANRQVLTYSPARPPTDGQWRTIKVEIVGKRKDHNVHSRLGYLAVSKSGGD